MLSRNGTMIVSMVMEKAAPVDAELLVAEPVVQAGGVGGAEVAVVEEEAQEGGKGKVQVVTAEPACVPNMAARVVAEVLDVEALIQVGEEWEEREDEKGKEEARKVDDELPLVTTLPSAHQTFSVRCMRTEGTHEWGCESDYSSKFEQTRCALAIRCKCCAQTRKLTWLNFRSPHDRDLLALTQAAFSTLDLLFYHFFILLVRSWSRPYTCVGKVVL